MGRSYHNDDYEERDRRRAKKQIKKNNRKNEKAHLKEFTCNNLSEDDFLDLEEDEYGNGKKQF